MIRISMIRSHLTTNRFTLKHLKSEYGSAHRQSFLFRAFSSQRAVNVLSLSSSPDIGAFGVADLHKPQDFMRLARKTRLDCEQLVARVLSCPPSLNVVHLFDDLSDTLCRLLDSAECCRNLHSSETWRASASEAYTEVASYMETLNTNVGLYNSLHSVVRDEKLLSTFSPEEQRTALSQFTEYQSYGIHLPPEELATIRALLDYMYRLQLVFSRNLAGDRMSPPDPINLPGIGELPRRTRSEGQPGDPFVRITPSPGRNLDYSDFPAAIRGRLKRSIFAPSQITVPLESDLVHTILSETLNPDIRRAVYVGSQSSAFVYRNLEVLDRLLEARDALAKIRGYPSWGAYALKDKVAQNPQSVHKFLTAVHSHIRPRAMQELELIRKAKLNLESALPPMDPAHAQQVQAWDLQFYKSRLTASTYSLSQLELSQYFSIDGCLQGLRLVALRLFGLDLRPATLSASEGWAPALENDPRRVRKFEVWESGSSATLPLGVIYMDLFSRAGKYGNAASFPLQFGRRLAPTSGNVNGSEGEYQMPKVCLSCSFDGGNLKRVSRQPPLLQHEEVEVLFHEFGHSLHFVLARTEMQLLGGTRGEIDFVEMPSHLMEYMAWDARILKLFAKHWETGETISDALITKLRGSKNLFFGLDVLIQLKQALLDQRLHGPKTAESSSLVLSSISRELELPHVDGTHWHATFCHLTTYGASYYSYLFCKVFAGAIWKQLFELDPLDPQVGKMYRDCVLRHGGTQAPMAMYRALLGSEMDLPAVTQAFIDGNLNHADLENAYDLARVGDRQAATL